MESNPSAHVNTVDNLFNCKACGAGHNETTFMQAILNCNFIFAKKLQRCFDNDEDLYNWIESAHPELSDLTLPCSLGISPEVSKLLNLVCTETTIQFPVFMYNHLVDIRLYNPGNKPKVRSRAGCPSGVIYPYDIWRDSPKTKVTLLCAGEKDMAVARSFGFNSITLTGGEQTSPQMLKEFEGRPVVIVYDNDEAGIAGAKKIAYKLYGIASSIKICTGFHEICKEQGQDITNFFMTYGKTKADLINYIETTPNFQPNADEIEA